MADDEFPRLHVHNRVGEAIRKGAHAMLVIPAIRLATPEDACGIAEMSRDCIEQGLGWSWTSVRVLKAIQDKSTNVAVIHQRGCVLTFGIMQYGEHRAHLALLCVDQAQRNQGFGSRMVAWLEECAGVSGIARIQVETRADNPAAIAFYQNLAYKPVGRVLGYYRGVIDSIRFEKNLWS